MLYEISLLGGAALLARTLIKDAFYSESIATKKKSDVSTQPIRAVQHARRTLTEKEKWDYFVSTKKKFEAALGTPDEKHYENKLIAAERLLQDQQKGFYFGDAIELGLESGKATRFPLYLKWQNLNNHYIVYGTTRFGKTRALANHMRQFIERGYNVIVIDPKGGEKHEILAWAAEFANSVGRLDDFMFYNPVYPELTDYFNPLFGKENDEIASELKLYAQGDPKSKDDFFTLRVPQVIKAIAAGCEYMESIYDRDGTYIKGEIEREIRAYMASRATNGYKVKFDRNMMIMKPDSAERAEERIIEAPKRGSQGAFRRKLMTFKDFAYYAMYDNLSSLRDAVRGTTVPNLGSKEAEEDMLSIQEEALMLLEGAMGESKEMYNKTTSGLIELLTKLSTGSVGKMFCTIPINPMLLRLASEDKGVIAVVQPNPLKYQSVSEMIMKIFLKTFETSFGNVAASGRVYNKKTVVLIDEASKAMFPGIEELFNKLGGIGLSLGLYTQSPADMIQMLGRETASVIQDNINTVAYMKMNDLKSKKEASENFGQRKVVDYQMQMQGGVGGMGRGGISSDLQDIVHADSFGELQIGEAMMMHYGQRYFVKLPFQPPPKSYMVMPDLSTEIVNREMMAFQSTLERDMLYRKKADRVKEDELGAA